MIAFLPTHAIEFLWISSHVLIFLYSLCSFRKARLIQTLFMTGSFMVAAIFSLEYFDIYVSHETKSPIVALGFLLLLTGTLLLLKSQSKQIRNLRNL